MFIQPGQSCAACTVTLRMRGVPPILNVQREFSSVLWASNWFVGRKNRMSLGKTKLPHSPLLELRERDGGASSTIGFCENAASWCCRGAALGLLGSIAPCWDMSRKL